MWTKAEGLSFDTSHMLSLHLSW